jgi:type I restriction enzyme S subunit
VSTWPLIKVSDACDLIVDCVNRTAPLAPEPTPYKMIRTTNVRDGFIDTDNVRYVDEATFQRWTRRAVPLPDDVVLTREAPLGEVGIIRDAESVFLGQRTIMYRATPGVLHPYFLLYSMLGPFLQGQIRGYGSGATVEHMRLPDCFNLLLSLPSYPIQRRIAAILRSYDDLIENNNHRVKILEEMAQRIYREWFLDFRYPGHENVPLVSSELGPIPRGWTWLRASEALVINPRIPVDREAIRPFVPMTSLSEANMHIDCMVQRAGTSGARFQNGDTLLARITPCLENGKTAYVQCLTDDVASGSTEFIVLRSRRLNPEYVYLLARSEPFRAHAIKSMSGATGRQRVRDDCFSSFYVPVPTPALLDSFTDLVRPMFTLSYSMFTSNESLRWARDLLLPRLISGEVDVADLDIADDEDAA